MQENSPRILIVDDEDALRTAVRMVLELEEFDVQEASNGTDGIKAGINGDFDLAIIDLKMPDVSGLEVLKRIRESKPNTICFIATAYASYDTAVEATKLGADGYIIKPFTPEELLQKVTTGMEKRRFLLEKERLRKEREASLLEVATERTRLKAIVNSIREGIIIVNKGMEVVYHNPAALKLLNMEYIPLGVPILEILPPPIRELLEKFFINTEDSAHYSIEMRTGSDDDYFIVAELSPVPHPDGSLAGAVITVRDITEFKKLELIKNQFISMVAHELKAPVAATLGFIDILRHPDIEISKEKQLDFMNRSYMRLTGLLQMVNDLLDISRMEMNKAVRELRPVCLEEIIAETVHLFSIEIEKKGLSVDMPDSGQRHIIPADKNELSRLFNNFISNAIKYNKQNGTIDCKITQSGAFVVISIRDTGIGLKPDEKNRLFSEFFRAKNEFTKNIHGTGLGLSIVKRIIDAYSGKIEVESTYGQGTTFKIFFPLQIKELTEMPIHQSHSI